MPEFAARDSGNGLGELVRWERSEEKSILVE